MMDWNLALTIGAVVLVGALAFYVGVRLGAWYLDDAVKTGLLFHRGVRYRIERIGRKPKED